MFKFKFKKEYINLIDTARENVRTYPERRLKYLIKKMNYRIKEKSFEGSGVTFIQVNGEDENCISDLKKYYKNEGFEAEIKNNTLWVCWDS
ncbi:MAG: hypothetical protein WD512_05135 [Candidatus Paceibacterota bacterium]